MSDVATPAAPVAPPSPEQQAMANIERFIFPDVKAGPAAFNNTPPAPVVTAPVPGTPATDGSDQFETVDPGVFLKDTFGFENVDAAKSAFDEWRNLKTNPPKAPEPTFANDESRRYYEYLAQGKEEELYNSLHNRRQIKGLDNMDEEKQLKLFLGLKNPMYDKELIDYAFNQSYGFDDSRFKNPETGEIIDQIGFKKAQIDAQYKRQTDIKAAQDFFGQYKQSIELQPLQAQTQSSNAEYDAFLASKQKDEEYRNQTIMPSLKAVQEVPLSFQVNDPNNQMNFGVNLALDKSDLDQARVDAEDVVGALASISFDKEGNFKADQLLRMFAIARNFDKYAQSVARQAVNAERARVIGVETPAPATAGRDVNAPVEDDMKKIEKYVFPNFRRN